MKLAFVDFVYHYDAARPEKDEPLGGTTSAVCFLARELVKSNISCAFFNRAPNPMEAHGIATFPLQSLGDEILSNAYDAFIFCGRWTNELVSLVRANTRAPLIAWAHESLLSPPMTPPLDDFDAIVFVSEWQQRINKNLCKPRWKQTVIRNAMNPAVAESFPPSAPILAAKTNPPVILFAGSFARGAFHIPPIAEKIRARNENFSVELFCNTDPSRDRESDRAYIDWLRAQPNIAHVGMVGQGELARRMRRASVFLAPNPWPETSCIALIEALASGLCCITTDRAALPETASGFAHHVPIASSDEPVRFDMPVDVDGFAGAALTTLRDLAENQQETGARLRRQVDYFQARYQWKQRVEDWVSFIKGL